MTRSGDGRACPPCTTIVRVSGPVPSNFDGDGQPFWLEEPKGRLNLSSSASVFDAGEGIVVAPIKVFEPFLAGHTAPGRGPVHPNTGARPAKKRLPGSGAGLLSKKMPKGVEVSIRSFGAEPGWVSASVLGTVVVPEAAASLRVISPSTTAGDAARWATLVVIKVREGADVGTDTAPSWPGGTLEKGTRVSLVSSPYGVLCPPVFGNQNASCAIANAIGQPRGGAGGPASHTAWPEEEAALYFVDTRVLPGSGGGAMMLRENGAPTIAGIIAEAFRLDGISVAGVELAAVMAIGPCWRAVSAFLAGQQGGVPPRGSAGGREVHPILPEETPLVLLRAGNSWASGVLLENGLVLSNAHFIAPFRGKPPPIDARVCVVPRDQSAAPYRKWIPVRTVYSATGSLDIAVFALHPADFRNIGSMLQPVRWDDSVRPAEGDDITVVGYPLFSPGSRMGPTVTQGALSKVVRARLRLPHGGEVVEDAMYVSSAAVHFGNSGGMLLDSQKRWIGLVACNARVGDAPPIPSMNFSIPKAALEFVRSYANNPQESAPLLSHADNVGAEMGQVWGLSPALPEQPLTKSKL